MLRVLTLAVLAYAALCAILFVQQRSLIYLPEYTRIAADRTDFELDRNGVLLRGWRHHPQRPHALLYFGGNGESIQHAAADLAVRLPDHAIYALAYRGYGASDGRPTEADLVADALLLYDTVLQRHGDARIAVIGRSLGSGVAAQVATQRRVDDLILVTPFDSLVGLAGSLYPFVPVRWLLRDRYESDRHLRGYPGRVLVVRAGRDEIIPAASTDRLLAVLPDSTQRLDLARAGHNEIDDDPAYLSTIAAFLTQAQDGQ